MLVSCLPCHAGYLLNLLCFRLLCETRRLEHQHLVVSKIVIARSYDFFSRFQPFKDFVELRILTSYAYLTFNSFSAFRRHDIYPFACSLLVECAAMDKYRFFRLSKLQIQVIGLAGTDV